MNATPPMNPTPTNVPGDLATRGCEPCRSGALRMDRAMAETYLVQVPGWSIGQAPDHLIRTWKVKDFRSAQDFALRVGTLCEAEGHHADIAYGWGYVTVKFWTHKIGGLHENDFIMAAKVDGLASAPYVPASDSMDNV